MKRRTFLTTSVGAAGAGLTGCGVIPSKKVVLKRKLPPFSFGDNYPKPTGSTLTRRELGTTGIKVSIFGFGSHMRSYLRPYEKERERMLRDAFEFGVNLFDLYDVEHNIYQYEPTARYLAPVINDCLISITIRPYDGRTLEEEMERDLRLFGKDYIDLVRIHAWAPNHPRFGHEWGYWEKPFKWKEEGKIRAVGVPVHAWEDLIQVLDNFPIDFVIFPYNFYHNIAFLAIQSERKVKAGDFNNMAEMLRKRGIGVITMKPFAGDNFVTPFKELAALYEPDVNFVQATLRYIINSGLEPDCTLAGMYYPPHVYENIDAYFKPDMNDLERKLLNKLRGTARLSWNKWSSDYYKFLQAWTPVTPEVGDTGIESMSS